MMNGIEAMDAISVASRELLIQSAIGDKGQVMVTVRDSGIGLDAHQFDHIFEAFFTTKQNGIGMGLSISRTIVEAHGGRLWPALNSGPGAKFQFTLPTAGTE
jgi:signal transduction histidine kinase